MRWLGDKAFPIGPPRFCELPGGSFELHGRGCDRSSHSSIDEEAFAVVGQAVASLVSVRGTGVGDAGAALSGLASLIAEAESRLPGAVADAREPDDTWAEIAARMASAASRLRHRYGHDSSWRADLSEQAD